jgi:hypothetical protein
VGVLDKVVHELAFHSSQTGKIITFSPLFTVRSDDIASFEMSELETLCLPAHQMLSMAGRNGVPWDLKVITEYIAELGLTIKAMDQNQLNSASFNS